MIDPVQSATSPFPSLTVVVPVFNEGPQIASSLEAIAAPLERYPGRTAVVAVDDGSSDDSGTVIEQVAARFEAISCERHARNVGYGGACRTGAAWASSNHFDYVAFIDSDLTNPPEDLFKVGELAKRGAAYVKGSRFLPGGSMRGVPVRRQIFSRSGYRVGSFLFGLPRTDVTNGFRAASTDLYCSWPLRETGFSIIMEEVYWALKQGVEIASFPTILRSRESDQRASSFVYRPSIFREYLRYPLRGFNDRHFRSR